MCNIPPELIGKRNPIKWDLIRDLMNDVDVLVHIADQALPELFNSLIVKRLNWDIYWLFRFNSFMKRKNYKRTWDLIRKARLGFLAEEELPKGTRAFDDAYVDPDYRYHKATSTTITSMVRRLFEAMVQSGILQPLPAIRPNWNDLHSRIPGIQVASTIMDQTVAHQALVIGAHFSNTTNAKKRAKLMREIALA